jgi:hypothetical protein
VIVEEESVMNGLMSKDEVEDLKNSIACSQLEFANTDL